MGVEFIHAERQTDSRSDMMKKIIYRNLVECRQSFNHHIEHAGSRFNASGFCREGFALNPSWKTDCLTPGFPESHQINAVILLRTRSGELSSPSFPFQQALITLPLKHNGVHKTPTDPAARGVSVSQGHPHT